MREIFKLKPILSVFAASLALFYTGAVSANQACVQVLDGSKSDARSSSDINAILRGKREVKDWTFDPHHSNLFRRLGLTQNATAKDLKEAYRYARTQYHPSSHYNVAKISEFPALEPVIRNMFQNIQEAYEILSAQIGTGSFTSADLISPVIPKGYHLAKPELSKLFLEFSQVATELATVKPSSEALRDYENRLEDLFIYDLTSDRNVRDFLLALAKSKFPNVAAKVNFYLGTKPQYSEFHDHLISVAKDRTLSEDIRLSAYKGMLTSFESSKEFRQILTAELVTETILSKRILAELIETGKNRLGAIELSMSVLPYRVQAVQKQIFEYLMNNDNVDFVKSFLLNSVQHGGFPSRELKLLWLEKVGYSFKSAKDRDAFVADVTAGLEARGSLERVAELRSMATTALRLLVKYHKLDMMAQRFILELAMGNTVGPIRLEAIRTLKEYFIFKNIENFLIATATNSVATAYDPAKVQVQLAAIDVLGEFKHYPRIREVLVGISKAKPIPAGVVLQRVRVILSAP